VHPATGVVTSVAATDTSIVVTSGSTASPTVATGTLDVIATQHAPAADWSNNSQKITSLADPGSATDAASMRYTQGLIAESPADRGLIAWTFPPSQIITEAVSTANLPSGDIALTKIWVRKAQTITNIVLAIGNAIGVTLTSSENFVGLYDSTGTRQGVSADQTTAWTTSGNKNGGLVIPLTSPYSAPAGFYWIAFLCNGTTGPTLCFAAAGNTALVNFGLGSSALFAGYIGGAYTSLPSSFTPSSVAAGHSGSFAYLAALS
jgi:hypothetical protein